MDGRYANGADYCPYYVTQYPHKSLYADSKVHGANMGPTWGRQDPGGPRVGHTNLTIWVVLYDYIG